MDKKEAQVMSKERSPTIFTSLDLEMNQPSGRIIQIGAVVGNINTGKIVDRFRLYINPMEELSGFITSLTGIKQEDVDNGASLMDGYAQLVKFHKQNNSFINPVTWGGGDAEELKRQMHGIYGINSTQDWPFGRRWIDVKTLYVTYRAANGRQLSGGLAKAMTKFGLCFDGRKHDAESDALNTFRFYCELLTFFREG